MRSDEGLRGKGSRRRWSQYHESIAEAEGLLAFLDAMGRGDGELHHLWTRAGGIDPGPRSMFASEQAALAFVLGAQEIMTRTHFVASRTYEHLALYTVAAILYFLLTWAGVQGLRAFERKVAIRGYGTH